MPENVTASRSILSQKRLRIITNNMRKGSSKISKIHAAKIQNNWTPKKRLEIQNFYDILESVAWLWRVFGVFPIAINNPIGRERYSGNKFIAVYSSLMFGVCLGNFVYIMMNYDYYFGRGSFRMTSLTSVVQSLGNVLSIFSSTAYRLSQQNALSESINSIAEQDIIMNKMNCRSNYDLCVKIIRTCVWTSLLAVIYFILYDINGIDRDYSIMSPEYFFWNLGLMIQAIDLTVFATLVGLLGVIFHDLNKKIRAVVTRANSSSSKVLVTSDVCAEQLRFISEIHYHMCTVGKQINRIFDWSVIINVMVAFVILSANMYYIFYEVQRPGETDIPQIISYIQWELFHSVPLIIVVIVSNLTSHQSIVTGKLIHEIRVENTDSDLYQAVKSFSLQLHHQRLEFTAGGFFPINSTLLQTMIGKITTYLVILIQFKPKLD
ncbi:gustatory receptor 68a-like [Venturia canescens]|uniref:gustatory receptor 68a-like n=1 Tax=Venturia canescens TaxID=32260 RepID=UPI001C9C8DE5|nr:gustatory receptor 68a-like [Venturia canescens]